MSRKDLGEALGYEGNSAIQVVARFESGRAGVPKTKIEQLLKLLGITNEDFGLSGSKSLKNFITASGFLGSSMVPWSDAMVGFLESTESSFVTQTLTDEDEPAGDSQSDLYQDVLRIMKLYRVQKQQVQLGLLEQLDLLDSLSEGDEEKLVEMLVILEVDPSEAYRVIENQLMERLKSPEK